MLLDDADIKLVKEEIARQWGDNDNLDEESSTSSKPSDFTSNLMLAGSLLVKLMNGDHNLAYGHVGTANAGSPLLAVRELMESPEYSNKTIQTDLMKKKGEEPVTLKEYSEKDRLPACSISTYFQRFHTEYATTPLVKGKKGSKPKQGRNCLYQYPKKNTLFNNNKMEAVKEKPSNLTTSVDLNALVTSAGESLQGSLQNFHLQREGSLLTLKFEVVS